MKNNIKSNPSIYDAPTLFTKFYDKNMHIMDELVDRSPSAFKIFRLLISNMDRYNAVVVSQITLSEILGVHRSSINRAIKILIEMKLVKLIKNGGHNTYAINANIVWKSAENNKKFATYYAKIISSENEQDDRELFSDEIACDDFAEERKQYNY